MLLNLSNLFTVHMKEVQSCTCHRLPPISSAMVWFHLVILMMIVHKLYAHIFLMEKCSYLFRCKGRSSFLFPSATFKFWHSFLGMSLPVTPGDSDAPTGRRPLAPRCWPMLRTQHPTASTACAFRLPSGVEVRVFSLGYKFWILEVC